MRMKLGGLNQLPVKIDGGQMRMKLGGLNQEGGRNQWGHYKHTTSAELPNIKKYWSKFFVVYLLI